MPIYEYQCENCNHSLEIIQKVNDPPPTDCPSCQVPKLRKKVSAVAFRLSGGGWYETDFKTGEKKNVVNDTEKADKSTSDQKASNESGSEQKSGNVEAKKDKSTNKTSNGDSVNSSS